MLTCSEKNLWCIIYINNYNLHYLRYLLFIIKINIDDTIVAIKVTIQLVQLNSNTNIADKPFIKQCVNIQGNTPFDTFLTVAKAYDKVKHIIPKRK